MRLFTVVLTPTAGPTVRRGGGGGAVALAQLYTALTSFNLPDHYWEYGALDFADK